jgi:hypothetical protein
MGRRQSRTRRGTLSQSSAVVTSKVMPSGEGPKLFRGMERTGCGGRPGLSEARDAKPSRQESELQAWTRRRSSPPVAKRIRVYGSSPSTSTNPSRLSLRMNCSGRDLKVSRPSSLGGVV